MRKIPIFLFICITLISITSCGGGGGDPISPSTHDLSGLIGVWDVVCNYKGTLDSSFGPMHMDELVITFWVVNSTHVKGEDGRYFVWSYDGNTLIVKNSTNDSDYDPDCGNITSTGSMELHIPIKPGANYAKFTGTMSLILKTQYCGNAQGSVSASGYIDKR